MFYYTIRQATPLISDVAAILHVSNQNKHHNITRWVQTPREQCGSSFSALWFSLKLPCRRKAQGAFEKLQGLDGSFKCECFLKQNMSTFHLFLYGLSCTGIKRTASCRVFHKGTAIPDSILKPVIFRCLCQAWQKTKLSEFTVWRPWDQHRGKCSWEEIKCRRKYSSKSKPTFCVKDIACYLYIIFSAEGNYLSVMKYKIWKVKRFNSIMSDTIPHISW